MRAYVRRSSKGKDALQVASLLPCKLKLCCICVCCCSSSVLGKEAAELVC